jgi:hypothetical protein
VEETMSRLLASAAPLLTPEEFARFALAVTKFLEPKSVGRTLHKRLQDRALSKKDGCVR